MKNKRLFTMAALMGVLVFSACKKEENTPTPEVQPNNPLKGTVWEAERYETPGGEFRSYTDRLLFKTGTTGEIVSIFSTVYYNGDTPGTTWDTTVAMSYELDTVNHELYVHSDYAGNPGRLTYNLDEETMTVVGDEQKVYIRIM